MNFKFYKLVRKSSFKLRTLITIVLFVFMSQYSLAKRLFSFSGSGNWNTANTWTTDASGTTLVSPSVPAINDTVTVLNGKTVIVSANILTNNLSVILNAGSVLDLQTSAFVNDLSQLRGSGRLRLSSVNFPNAATNTFVNIGGGTTEYCNTASFTFPTQTIYNNLELNLSSVVIIATQSTNLTLNGNLNVTRGTFRINDNLSTVKLNTIISGSVNVMVNGRITVGNGATNTSTSTTVTAGGTAPFLFYYEQFHRVSIGGSLINNGLVKFTNMAAPDFNNFPSLSGVNAGAASVYFLGAKNDSIICNNTTDFYNLVIDKGIDQTFKLTVRSSNYFNFRLFGPNDRGGYNGGGNPNLQKALWIRTGTVVLENKVIIPSLSEGECAGSPNGDFYIPVNAALVINHSDVILLTTADNNTEVNLAYGVSGSDGTNVGSCSSFSVYGKFVVNAGYVSTRESGSLIYWAIPGNAAQFEINGGFIDGKQVRSANGGGGFATFNMTGGQLLLRGRFTRTTPITFAQITQDLTNTGSRNGNGINGSLGTFNIDQNVNTFKMSGGNITVLDLCGGSPAKAIEINSLSSNVIVSGGSFTIKTHTQGATGNNYFVSADGRIGNLIIQRVSGTTYVLPAAIPAKTGVTARLTLPLRVLNKMLLVGNGEFRNDNNLSVFIGGDLEINAGSVFNTGTNEFTFDNFTGYEKSASLINNGTITTGFNDFIVNKFNDSITIAGSGTSITILDELKILQGSLLDNGKTINVAGNITNTGVHTGIGKIVMNGTTIIQRISGNGNGQFGNLELNNSGGVAGSIQIEMLANQKVNGNLTFTSSRIFDIKNYQLSIASNTVLIGTFNSNCFIRTNGNQSNGGIKKTFNSTSAFIFPVGTGTNYTPASIQFSANPTTYGSISIRPVNSRNRYVTDAQAFPYYWNIASSGFTGIPASSINHIYNYGNLTDNILYVPGHYNPSTTSFNFINDVNEVNEANNTINFIGVNDLNGDFTAGVPAAFGLVTVFYSRQNGNYNNPLTWSIDNILKHAGSSAVTVPGASNPVVIGDGITFFHTILVVLDSAQAGSLQISSGSILDVATRKGNNFGVLTDFDVIGSGKLKISSTLPNAEFPAGDFGQFIGESGGTVEYYTTGAVDYNIPATSISPSFLNLVNYRNLEVTPAAGRIITMPDVDIQVFENFTSKGIGTGQTNLNTVNSRTLNVDSSLVVQSGVLRFFNTSIQTINIGKNLEVATGATFGISNTGSALIHLLNISKNIINNGTIDFNDGANRIVNLVFNSSFNSSFSGTGLLTDIGLLRIDKGNDRSTILDFSVSGTLTATINNWLTLTNGTFRVSRSGGTYLTPTFFIRNDNSIFTIPQSARFSLNNATAFIRVGSYDNDGSDIRLEGELEIINGSFYQGDTTRNRHHDIEFSASGLSEIDVQAGRLYVNGQIRANALAGNSILNYKQSGGNVIIAARNGAGTGLPNFQVEGLGSVFNMSNNAQLTMKRATNNSQDMIIRPEFYSVTGGTIIFAKDASATTDTIDLSTSIELNNLEVRNFNSTIFAACRMVISPLQLKGNLTIQPFAVFRANGHNVSIGGNFTNQNASNLQGLTVGGYMPGSSSQLTTFNSVSSNQLISGVSGNRTNFAELVILNSSDTVKLFTNTLISVNNQLSIINGVFNDGGNIITLLGDVFNSSQHFGTGSILFAGNNTQAISGNGFGRFANISINNLNNGAIASGSFQINGVLNFISNAVLDINQYKLTLTNTATPAVISSGSPLGSSNSRFIETFGLPGDLGVQKSFPIGAHNFVFPIGVFGKYTPAQINVTANTATGTVIIKPINAKHPLTTDIAVDKELAFYWITTPTGFAGLTVNQSYTYQQIDVNGTEANYDDGRLLSTDWTSTGSVNTSTNVISYSGVSYLEGEYTAGEPSEFSTLIFFYSRNISNGGNWNDTLTWSTDKILKHNGAKASTIPAINNGVVIANGHIVTVNSNNTNAAKLALVGNARLDIAGSSVGHSYSLLNGTGTLVLNSSVFPSGDFSEFFSTSGGTVQYSGSYTIPNQALYNNLIFSGSGTKTLPPTNFTINGDLTINGVVSNLINSSNIIIRKNWINNGIYLAGNSTVFLNSASAQSISGDSISRFHNLTIQGSGIKTLGTSMRLKGTLLAEPNTTFVSNGLLTITSDALNTGRVAELPTTANIVGQINVQRYIPQIITGPGAPRRNRFLSVPVNTSNSFNLLELQDDIFISGPNPALNGFDVTPNNRHSIYKYDETVAGIADYGYQGFATTSTNTPTATGLVVLVRGTRAQGSATFTPPFVNPDPVTMDYTGEINRGNISANVTYTATSGGASADGYNLVGNPYPSAIDWESNGFTKTNIEDAIYIYNPSNNSYASYINGIGTNGGSRYIASGQAFFVHTNALDPELTFRENVKVTNTPSNMFRSATLSNLLKIKLVESSVSSDEIAISFDAAFFNNHKTNEDAVKLLNPILNISSFSNDRLKLSINRMGNQNLSDTIPLSISGSVKSYTLEMDGMNSFIGGEELFLKDNFTGITYNLQNTNSVSFNITSDIRSTGDLRFELIRNQSSVLPISLLSFSGKKQNNTSLLEWKTSNEINNQKFNIERSLDGITFKTLGEIKPKFSSISSNYNFLDENPALQINYYRLKQTDLNGKFTYSKLISINFSSLITKSTKFYPIPATDVINVSFESFIDGNITIQILDVFGKIVYRNEQKISKGNTVISESINHLIKGAYIIELKNNNSIIEKQTFIKI